MSKRGPQSSPKGTPKSKRSKPSGTNQLQLDTFFGSPSSRKAQTTVKTGETRFFSNATEPIDVDALDSDVQAPASSIPLPGAAALSEPAQPPPISAVESLVRSPRKPLVFGAKAVEPEKLIYQRLDTDPVFYDPASQPWTSTEAPYAFLAHTLATLSQTRSRISILNTLTNALRTILHHHAPSLLPSLYLLSNSLSPSYVGIELGIGASVISKAIQQVSGLSPAALKQLYTTTGDAGDVAFEAKSKVRTLIPHLPLTIQDVYKSLLKIAACRGQGAAKDKQKIVERLLVAGSGEEVRYLVRTLTLNLRVGAVRTSILTALARAVVLHGSVSGSAPGDRVDSCYATKELLSRIKPLPSNSKKKGPEDTGREDLKGLFLQAEGLVKQVFVQHPCYDDIIEALLDTGLDRLLDRVPLTVGIPLHPTLGSPTRSLDEIYERLGDAPFSAEFKYDGQRAQIHAQKETDGNISVKIFSRHLEDMTSKYPDVTLLVRDMFKQSSSITSFILDSEIVAVDHATGELKSFQELSNRARKDVSISDIKISVSVFVFDLLYLNNESYLAKPFRQRRQALKRYFPPHSPGDVTAARLCHVQSCESEQGLAAIQEFWEKAVESRCEGLMVKVLDYEPVESNEPAKAGTSKKKQLPATYEPDKRTSAWLKLKKDYVDSIGDSLDLIPIGAWYGNGRKAGWWSPILLGLWNPETGRIVAVCKCMSGFTDVFYKSLSERYPANSNTCSAQTEWDCDLGGFRPDVYFKPGEVWEIRGADITESPVSVAARGLVSDTRGLSVRFPRFIKLRDDKGVEEASTPSFLASMWRKQQGNSTLTGVDDGDLMDADVADSEIDESSEDDLDVGDDF